MKRIAIGIQYDGAPWQGWQTQPHGLTVQDALQAAIRQFALQDIPVQCAGRTDTGVHAIEQVVAFRHRRGAHDAVVGARRQYLPAAVDRRALGAGQSTTASMRGSAPSAAPTITYLYNHPVRAPLLHGRAGWAFRPLDAARMHDAAQHLVGTP